MVSQIQVFPLNLMAFYGNAGPLILSPQGLSTLSV